MADGTWVANLVEMRKVCTYGVQNHLVYYTSVAVPSLIRTISDNGPVQLRGSDPSDFLCGKSPRQADLVAPASPGSQIVVSWVAGDGTSAVRGISPLCASLTHAADD